MPALGTHYHIAVMHELSFISARLAEYRPAQVDTPETTREAAVAVILRPRADDTELLFIQRAVKTGDPWSGHMAFPGGHRDPGDPHLRAAAERETLEEIGLDLTGAVYLGALDHQHAMPRGRPINLRIAPHVYAIEGNPPLEPNYEVHSVVWSSLRLLSSNRCHDIETRRMAGVPTVFNGYRLEGGHFVWGLTYRMLKSFFTALNPSWQPPDER
jgi:8-oxo-dGTP pyrophosphatase MutT (NUDIX family)